MIWRKFSLEVMGGGTVLAKVVSMGSEKLQGRIRHGVANAGRRFVHHR